MPSDGPVAHQILKTASCEATRRSLREAQNWSVDQGEDPERRASGGDSDDGWC